MADTDKCVTDHTFSAKRRVLHGVFKYATYVMLCALAVAVGFYMAVAPDQHAPSAAHGPEHTVDSFGCALFGANTEDAFLWMADVATAYARCTPVSLHSSLQCVKLSLCPSIPVHRRLCTANQILDPFYGQCFDRSCYNTTTEELIITQIPDTKTVNGITYWYDIQRRLWQEDLRLCYALEGR